MQELRSPPPRSVFNIDVLLRLPQHPNPPSPKLHLPHLYMLFTLPFWYVLLFLRAPACSRVFAETWQPSPSLNPCHHEISCCFGLDCNGI